LPKSRLESRQRQELRLRQPLIRVFLLLPLPFLRESCLKPFLSKSRLRQELRRRQPLIRVFLLLPSPFLNES